jgi:hypothetical protein
MRVVLMTSAFAPEATAKKVPTESKWTPAKESLATKSRSS